MAGFQTKRNNRHLIKEMRKNIPVLNYLNIDDYIGGLRSDWDLQCRYEISQDKTSMMKSLNPTIITKEDLIPLDNPISYEKNELPSHLSFGVYCGYWGLTFNCDNQFTFVVNVGRDEYFYHPLRVNDKIKHLDSQTQREFKKLVMKDWKSSCKTLLDMSQEVLPGYKSWSVTCCEKSTNLLKQIKDDRLITQNPGVSFLFL